MWLLVARVVKDYSTYRGELDIADLRRSMYKARRSYFPSLYWIIDYATINAYKVGKQLHLWTDENHLEFRSELVLGLCSFFLEESDARSLDLE